jgi:hypothetical protein
MEYFTVHICEKSPADLTKLRYAQGRYETSATSPLAPIFAGLHSKDYTFSMIIHSVTTTG